MHTTYQYDSLNRLITASSSQSWGETYGFDSFGNLLSKTGRAERQRCRNR